MAKPRLFEMQEWKKWTPATKPKSYDQEARVFYVGAPILLDWKQIHYDVQLLEDQVHRDVNEIILRTDPPSHEVLASALKSGDVLVFTKSIDAELYAEKLMIQSGMVEKYGRKFYKNLYAVFAVDIPITILQRALQRDIFLSARSESKQCEGLVRAKIVDAANLIYTNGGYAAIYTNERRILYFIDANDEKLYFSNFGLFGGGSYSPMGLINSKLSNSKYPEIISLILNPKLSEQGDYVSPKVLFCLFQNVIKMLPREAVTEKKVLNIICVYLDAKLRGQGGLAWTARECDELEYFGMMKPSSELSGRIARAVNSVTFFNSDLVNVVGEYAVELPKFQYYRRY